MSEGTVRFYVALSHTSLGFFVFLATGVIGSATFLIGKRWRDRRETRWIVAQLLLWPMLLSGVWFCLAGLFHVGCAAQVGRSVQCQRNMKDFGTAMLMYAQDHDETFPPASRWEDALSPYQKTPLGCPDARTQGGYAMNRAASSRSQKKIEAPAELILLFEADTPTRSFAGNASNLAKTRHGSAPTFLFADGHARSGNRGTLAELLWTNAPDVSATPSSHERASASAQ